MLFSRSRSDSVPSGQAVPTTSKQQPERDTRDTNGNITSSTTHASSSKAAFQPTFERNLNKELEAGLPPPPPFDDHHINDYPPPPGPPPPPFTIPTPRWQSGVYVPTPVFILLVLILLLETIVIVFYTGVALYSTLPAAGFHLRNQACPQSGNNFYLANAASPPPSVVTVTAPVSTSRTTFSTIPAITPTLAFTTIYSTTNVLASPASTTSSAA